MDLMLSNFIVDEAPKKAETKHVHRTNDEPNSGGDGGFSMTFKKALPVKAVVARKRPAVKLGGTQLKEVKPTNATDGLNIKKSLQKTANSEESTKSTSIKTNDDGKPSTGKTLPPKKVSRKEAKTASSSTEQKHLASTKAPFKFTDEGGSGGGAGLRTNRKPNIFDRLKTDMPKVELPAVQPLKEQVFSEQTIDSLAIYAHSKKNIVDLLHYTHLTVVQSMAIPRLLEGRDALIRAQTGSGKTLAYAVPMIEALHSVRPKTSRTDGIRAVVIVPTRELALQTYELLVKLLKPYTWLVASYLCGGEKRKTEKARLRAGLNILIGTPGRFCDHIRNTASLKLNGVRWLVLDEADRLLELGYEKDVKEIVGAIQNGRSESGTDGAVLQTVLLSATLTASVKELAGLTLHDPVYVETSEAIRNRQSSQLGVNGGAMVFSEHLLNVDECVTIPDTVKQRYLVIPPKLRLVTLSGLIAAEQRKKASKALVFMATQDLVDFHYDIMVEVLTRKRLDSEDEREDEAEDEENVSEKEDDDDDEGNSVLLPQLTFFKLHGRMSQVERSSVFQEFRKAKAAVLLCTDVAARGIDVPAVDLVVQYHAPQILADYVHRVGRTARAGQSGKAVLFIEPAEVEFIKYLAEKQIRIQEEKIDGIFVCLGQLLKCRQKRIARNKEKAAVELQHRFEVLVANESELFASASKAFVSWVRYYSNFPKELRRMFAIRAIHMGHYAKCLGLRDPPKKFMSEHTGPTAKGEGSYADDNEQQQATLQRFPSSSGRGRGLAGRRGARRGASSVGVGGRSSRVNGSGPVSRRGGHDSTGRDRRGGRSAATGGGAAPRRDLADYAKHSRVLNTSEFDSGLEPVRKKAKH
ncbi:probable ATP-dependent RNA helicase CG8611 isoform X1 [Anopheles darlingi]|uniref:probable ATP-dependent RNA helicase CG8611 isoform X1 n=2 Tax=Anopheles darlingi TaxID=43151 RepID=UPI0021002C33|nr:probable ATP-dependent RNA helicase CG8611 isoform X1 [Anopheles darlingi]